MSTTEQDVELDAAIAAAELNDDEAARVRELVTEGAEPGTAVALVYGERDAGGRGQEPVEPAAVPPPPVFVVDDKKLEKEVERHLERMAELLGPTATDYQPCEECGGAGLREAGPRMVPHEMYRACPTCEGFGKVLTGAKDPQFATQPCPDCAGRGFQTRTDAPAVAGGATGAVNDHGDGYGTESWMGDPAVQPKQGESGWR